MEKRIEDAIMGLMPAITENDMPYLGCCYGSGILAHHLEGDVSKARYGEEVGAVECAMTEEGVADLLLEGLPEKFMAFVGHKEAVQELPPECSHLLASAPCPFQMIRYKSNVYATQFHPEADSEVFEARINIYKDGFVSQMVYDRDSRRDSIMVAVWNERLDPDDMEDPEPVCLSSLPEAARLPCDPV